jgi:uncharacterized protein YjiS (DUF1127 family)
MTSTRTSARPTATRHPRSLHALWAWLARTLRSFLQRWAQMQLERSAVQALSDLNDYQLMDIGLTRSEIRSALAGRLHHRITTTRKPRRPWSGPTPMAQSAPPCGSAS